MNVKTLIDVLVDIWNERVRQHEKWGVQHHPDGTGHAFALRARQSRAACENAFSDGMGTWRHILEEEVAEAFAEQDTAKLREELVQVAAVAASWIQDIDSREAST